MFAAAGAVAGGVGEAEAPAAGTDLDVLRHVDNMHDAQGAVCSGCSTCKVLQRQVVQDKLHQLVCSVPDAWHPAAEPRIDLGAEAVENTVAACSCDGRRLTTVLDILVDRHGENCLGRSPSIVPEAFRIWHHGKSF